MPSGRPRNIVLQNKVNRLAREGLSGSAIARRLGISRQHVHIILKGKYKSNPLTLICADCGITIAKVSATYRDLNPVYCPGCLAKHPRVSFDVRIRLLRLAKGWTLADLAQRAGISVASLDRYELGLKPRPKRAEQLIAPFGPVIRK